MQLLHAVVLLACISTVFAAVVERTLKFNPDGTFKLAHFTDMHFGETDVEDFATQNVQRTVLKAENPDLVILGGDQISGYAYSGGQGWFASKYARVVHILQELKFRWAMALGNHDSEADLDRRAITKLDMSYDYSLTEMGPDDINGATNYILNILSSTGNHTVARLYFFDSLRDHCLGVRGWGCVMHNQVEWYRKWIAKQAAEDSVVPAVAFIHIPLPEMITMWNYHDTFGSQGDWDGVCCSSLNTGLFAAFKEFGEVRAIISGHDHANDFIGEYQGVLLGYGRKSGYGGYFKTGWSHGSRILQLREKPFSISTWIREESGGVDDQQSRRNEPGPHQRKLSVCCNSYSTSFWDQLLGENASFHLLWITLPIVTVAIMLTWQIVRRFHRAPPVLQGHGNVRSRSLVRKCCSRLCTCSLKSLVKQAPQNSSDKYGKYSV